MYTSYNNSEFKKQEIEIWYHTVVLCQDKASIPLANAWIKKQKDIPYLPKSDMFAYYCPMCNHILSVGHRCGMCNQLIKWSTDMLLKPISGK